MENNQFSSERPQFNANDQDKLVDVNQKVAILVDGNNIGKSVWALATPETMIDYDMLIPDLLNERPLNRLIYFREGKSISHKFERRLRSKFFGSVVPSGRSAVIPITIAAMQLAEKVDTIILMSGNDDFVELIKHIKALGVRVEVASLDHSTSFRVKSEADFWFNISEDYFFSIERDPNAEPSTFATAAGTTSDDDRFFSEGQ